MPSQGPTRILADFVSELRYDDLGEPAVGWCKTLVLDQLGSELVGSTMPWAKKVFRYVKGLGGSARCTVVNYGLKTNPELAAFANGTFGHSFDIDDFNGYGRPGSAIIPAVLALGEERGISGRDFILSTVAAYEVWVRVMNAISPSSLLERGFHTVSVNGVVGAAAGAAKVLSLATEKIANAFGLAASHAGGLTEFTISGTDVMRIHAGIASAGGLRSAMLASVGFTGPQNILEGEKGYLQAFANSYDMEALTRGLGRDWLILKTGIKPYACAASIHPAIHAIEKLHSRHRLEISDIKEVVLGTNSLALRHGGGKIGPRPNDVTGMQYSMEFGAALALVKRDNLLEGYAEKNLHNPKLLNMARKVRLVLDEEIENELQGRGRIAARVTLVMRDGSRLEESSEAWGQHYLPLSREEITKKFVTLARTVLSARRAKGLQTAIENLQAVKDVSSISKLVVAA